MKVSEIILQQIGGAGKLTAMIGVKHFINLSDGLGGLGIRFTIIFEFKIEPVIALLPWIA